MNKYILRLLNWLCSVGLHKLKCYVSMDFSEQGNAVTSGRACVRCKHFIVDDIKYDVVSELTVQMEMHQRDILVVADFASNHVTQIIQELTKNREVKVKLKPNMVVMDEVAYAPGDLPDIPIIRPPNEIIPAQHLCPMCDKAMTPDPIIKNMFDCNGCKLSFGKYQLEMLKKIMDSDKLTLEEKQRNIQVAGMGMYGRPKAKITNMRLEEMSLMPDGTVETKISASPKDEDGFSKVVVRSTGNFSVNESDLNEAIDKAERLCKHWDGWYCTAPELLEADDPIAFVGCYGELDKCVNPKYKLTPTQDEIEEGLGNLFGGDEDE